MSTPFTLQPLLDRRADLRSDPEGLLALWSSPGARVVLVDEGGRYVVAPAGGTPDGGGVFLGTGPGSEAWFAVRTDAAALDAAAQDPTAQDIGAQGAGRPVRVLRTDPTGGVEMEAAQAAVAILAWHSSHVACERCGGASEMVTGGFSRRCTDCGRELFPRTDPAMIVALLDRDDRLLLAHQGSWPENRVSLLAGFLEAGESAEHAVVREVAEEVGLQVDAVRYLASQPWPFPRSLMLGFVARGRGEVCVDPNEIEWARWFSPAEFEAALASGGVTAPAGNSIAARIVRLWRNGRLPVPEGNELVR